MRFIHGNLKNSANISKDKLVWLGSLPWTKHECLPALRTYAIIFLLYYVYVLFLR
ncbi:hypothetical protein H4683_003238 [Filibacter limicola]|uniref:Uncharacterized protein n=1 Tax=Sporosarcina limicola TaxID=34101 RepID=A0A927MN09_9BACL|nr:hypothetical protein [Sporosarcina limicola]